MFMALDGFEGLGLDLQDCLRTFKLHASVSLPLRPPHIKSAMRLRKAPPQLTVGEDERRGASRTTSSGTAGGRVLEKGFPAQHGGGVFAEAGGGANEGDGGGWGGGGGGGGGYRCGGGGGGSHHAAASVANGRDGACEHAQHFAWFLLTSASLSKVRKSELGWGEGLGGWEWRGDTIDAA